MNKKQRERVGKILEKAEELRFLVEEIDEEEQEKWDNMPEGLQGSEQGERLQSSLDFMDLAVGNLEELIENLTNAMEA